MNKIQFTGYSRKRENAPIKKNTRRLRLQKNALVWKSAELSERRKRITVKKKSKILNVT